MSHAFVNNIIFCRTILGLSKLVIGPVVSNRGCGQLLNLAGDIDPQRTQGLITQQKSAGQHQAARTSYIYNAGGRDQLQVQCNGLRTRHICTVSQSSGNRSI
ncbi:hypothetical protein PR002_g16480 [Phytophthora rubi]|uniref:Uncharacterized protein n=1 Tax=Phytophthora rubi TaxID=129364 RepID=A0A6A3KH83_9STRA|nr:hypothetical protein PR002_g16480 [Phytophthora rubi]